QLAERRWPAGLLASKGALEVAEQPRSAEAAAAHHDAVTAGAFHHRERVVGGPDVAVAEHRYLTGEGLAQLGDGAPRSVARVPLDRGAGMERDRGGALVGRDATALEEGEPLVVEP